MLQAQQSIRLTSIANSRAPLESTRSLLMIVLVGLNCWYLGLSGSRNRFSDIVSKVYGRLSMSDLNISIQGGRGQACTFRELSARSLELGRVIPGSISLRNFCRLSCSAASWAAVNCGVARRVRRSAASAKASEDMVGDGWEGDEDMVEQSFRCSLDLGRTTAMRTEL